MDNKKYKVKFAIHYSIFDPFTLYNTRKMPRLQRGIEFTGFDISENVNDIHELVSKFNDVHRRPNSSNHMYCKLVG